MTTGQPTYLITGATGFLGRHILESLTRAVPGARLVVLVRDARAWEAQDWGQTLGEVGVIAGRLFPADAWRADPRLDDLTGIFHLAGEVKHSRSDTGDMWRTNVEGTLAMVRLAAEMKSRLLFVSTSGTVSCSTRAAEGVYEDAPYREDIVGGWPYYASKIEAEKEGRRLARELGVKLIVFRPPVLLGPGDHRYRSTSNVVRILRKRLPFIIDGGMNFVDVRDAADAMVAAMRHPNPKPIYHLAGAATTLDEFFRMVVREGNIEPSWTILPGRLMRFVARANAMTGSRLHMVPDPVVVEMAGHHWDIRSRHAEADLGYRSRAPELTIADTISWLRANHPELRGSTGSRPDRVTPKKAAAVTTAV